MATTGNFEMWQEMMEAIQVGTVYWNVHKHSFVWERRSLHQSPQQASIAPQKR